jgi:hypothetical protein
MTFRGSCPLVALPTRFGNPGFYFRNDGLPVGCVPDGPAKCIWVLGRYRFETCLRSACLEWFCQTPYSYARYLDVSTLLSFKIDVISQASSSTVPGHHNFSYVIINDFFVQCTFQDPTGYPRILDIADLRTLRGRHAYKASVRSALPDSLQLCSEIWVPLHFVRLRP